MKDDITSDDNLVFTKILDAVGLTQIKVIHKKTRTTFGI